MYVFDTNAFLVLGHYYPDNFPTLWEHLEELVVNEEMTSVKEVKRELELNSHSEHIEKWVKLHSKIFKAPSHDEMIVVSEIFQNKTFQGLVKKSNLLKGLPVADPFIVASAKVKNACVVTQEKYKKHAARIPNVCEKHDVPCIKIQTFLKQQKLKF
jgi:replicative DNA helicase